MRSWNGFSNSLRVGLIALFFWVVSFVTALDVRAELARADTAASSAAELLDGFREMPGLEARFEEEKTLALLAAPLRSTGRLYFSPPSTLLRRVETPHRQEILIHANQIRISHGEEVQLIDLAARKEIRPLVDSLIWIFTGDLASIEKFYRVVYEVIEGEYEGEGKGKVGVGAEVKVAEGFGDQWQMRLIPVREPLSNLLQELQVRGAGRAVHTLELIETSGDRTLTHILNANPQRRFSRAEQLELFGIGDR